MFQAIVQHLSVVNAVFFFVGLVLGIFVVGKLTVSEILNIIGEILTYILTSESRSVIGVKDGDKKMDEVLDRIEKEISPSGRGILGVLWGGTRKAAQQIFDKVAVPVINNSLIRRIR